MKITSATLIGFGLINFLAISPGIAASKLTVEQRLNQLETRLQQAELRASIAEQKNAQLNAQVQHVEQQSQQAQQASQDLAQRTSKIEKITPDDNGYFELHGYARSGMMT